MSYSDSVDESIQFNGVTDVLNSKSSGKNVNGIGSVQLDYQKNFLNTNQLRIGVKGNNTLSNSSVFLETISTDSLVNSRDNKLSV